MKATKEIYAGLKHLSRKELDALLCVPTTVAEAKQIKKRQIVLLRDVRTIETAIFDKTGKPRKQRKSIPAFRSHGIGCPHCGIDSCNACAWALYHLGQENGHCCIAKFGGHSLRDVRRNAAIGIHFWAKYEYVIVDAEGYDYTTIRNSIDSARTFLGGHIEWADAVIALGGVPWPEEKKP